jgi:hypothetical protein
MLPRPEAGHLSRVPRQLVTGLRLLRSAYGTGCGPVASATGSALFKAAAAASVAPMARDRMTQLHDLRLRLLVQQESERIADSQLDGLDLSVVQARCLCWLALLAEAHEDQASDAERQGDVEQAMSWFADSMRLRDVIQVVGSIEIPLPAALDPDDPGSDGHRDHGSRRGPWVV